MQLNVHEGNSLGQLFRPGFGLLAFGGAIFMPSVNEFRRSCGVLQKHLSKEILLRLIQSRPFCSKVLTRFSSVLPPVF